MRILVVEDEKNLNNLIVKRLTAEKYSVDSCFDGEDAIYYIENTNYDVVILDIMIPKINGFDVIRKIRNKGIETYIIALTAMDSTEDIVTGLNLGADDYMVKPFDSKELVARVKAVLRRYEQKPAKKEEKNKKLVFSNLEINISNYTVQYNGEYVDFPPKEFELLHYLAEHPNQVFTREQLLDRIWGYEYIGDTRTVDVHIKRIREKLNKQEENWSIKTVWGVGYKFEVK